MGQRNLSFIEANVEKLAVGVGGALLLAGIALVVMGPGVRIDPQEIPKAISGVEQKLAASESTLKPEPLTRAEEAAKLLSLQLPASSARIEAAAGARTFGLPWSRPSAGEATVGPTTPEGTWDRPLTPPAGSLKLAGVAAGLGFASRGGKPADEWVAVQIRADLDAKAIYTSWFPLYPFLRRRAEDLQTRQGIPIANVDYSDAMTTFSLSYAIRIVATEVQIQHFDPVKGWETGPDGKDLWQTVQRPYGPAGDEDVINRLAAVQTDTKLPKYSVRRAGGAPEKTFDSSYLEIAGPLSKVFSVGAGEWTTPPGVGDPKVEVTIPGQVGRKAWMERPPAVPVVGAADGPVAKEDPKGDDPLGLLGGKNAKKPGEIKADPKKVAAVGESLLTVQSAVDLKCSSKGYIWPLGAVVTAGIGTESLLRPGHTYRFRVRAVLLNPLFNWRDAAREDLENKLWIASDWTDASEPVVIPEIFRVHVLSGERFGGNVVNRPLLQISRWLQGEWYGTRNLRVTPGEIIRPERYTDLLSPPNGKALAFDQRNKAQIERAISLFDTGCVLLSVREYPRLLDRAGARAQGNFPVTRGNKTGITYVDGSGVIRTQYAAFDGEDLKKPR